VPGNPRIGPPDKISRKLHWRVLNSELELRQETAADMPPARGLVLKRYAEIVHAGPLCVKLSTIELTFSFI